MIAIVDCNSFYCSCERLFRPALLQRPVAVLSNNDGCIISRSDEAKQLGVAMAGPYFLAKDIIERHGVQVFSSNYNLYGDLSMRVMDTLRNIAGADKVEVYSVDEAFVDLSHVPSAGLQAMARRLKDQVEEWTGISVSVGIASTRTLAKLANNIAKKNKQSSGCITIIGNEGQRMEALQQARVGELWGVGRANADKLRDLGITNGWELASMPEEWAHRNLGGVVGTRLIRELQGIPSLGMKNELVQKKMIATTRMFGSAVNKIGDIREAVATYTSRAAEKLRRQRSAANTLSVFIVKKDTEHTTHYRHGDSLSSFTRLPIATSNTQDLIRPAMQLVDELYRSGTSYKKAGVILGELVPEDAVQANLFEEDSNSGPRKKLMEIVDNVNFSHRDDLLKFASTGTDRDWKMRQELRSPRYTTRWDELMEVK